MKRTREEWAAEAIELVACRNYPVYVTDTLVVGRNPRGWWWVDNGKRTVSHLTVDQAVDEIISSLT